MKLIKLLASVATISAGILGASVGYVSPAPEGDQMLIMAFGVVLILDSLACLYGANIAFAGSAVVSGLFVFSAWVGWGGGYSGFEWAALAVALVNIVMSVIAYRSSSTLSEQANPMNLPVFG